MDYFSKLLRAAPRDETAQPNPEHALLAFTKSWLHVKETLEHPDERQLSRGILSTDVPAELHALVNALVLEASDSNVDTTGACLEYTLKNDVLNTLVRLSQRDRPFGIKAEVVKTILNLVVLMDEHFLVHATVHKAVLRLLRACVRDDYETFDGRTRAMGAAAARNTSADYEEDLVNLMCALCSRIRLYPELLLIFFYDKRVYHAMDEEDEEPKKDEDDEDADVSVSSVTTNASNRSASPALSSATVTSARTSYPASSVYRRPEYEFLLYNHLLRFVHREGEVGDSARAGLLFLMDVATSLTYGHLAALGSSTAPSDPLSEAAAAFSEYILEGDFADVLAAALGAVYSSLPSKLIVRREGGTERNGGMILGGLQPDPEEEAELQAELEKSRAFGLDTSTSPEFKARIQHFIKMIEFVQDVVQVELSTSDDGKTSLLGISISKSIVKFLRSSFLTNVLYPSILECSDSDGSAVAVITYMDALLSSLKEPELADVVIKFLTSEEEQETSKDTPSALSKTGAHRKKGRPTKRPKSTAMTLLELEANPRSNVPYYNSLGRFTLKDLLLSNVESKFQHTATAALQLLNMLLRQHGLLSLDRLFTLIPDSLGSGNELLFQNEDSLKTPRPGLQVADDDFFISSIRMATSNNGQKSVQAMHDDADEVDLYRNLAGRLDHTYIASSYSGGDSQYLQDAEGALDAMSSAMALGASGYPGSGRKYRLSPTDPLITQLLESLQRFFSHPSEQNLALTGVIHAIACSPQLSLSGWLTYDASSGASAPPAMYTCFASLVSQVPQYGMQAPQFEKYLDERRRGLLSSAHLADAIDVELTVQPRETAAEPAPSSAPSTPAKPKKRSAGFVAYFSPRRAKAAAAAADDPQASESRTDSSREFESPLAQHYRETASVTVTPLKGAAPREGPWSPSKGRKKGPVGEDEADALVAWGGEVNSDEPDSSREEQQEETTTLSVLLDNVVVLEEALKEIGAVLEMRRVMGIDE